jgi:hypothetical protein
MKERGFFTTVGVVFLLVFVVHLLRVVNGWSFVVGSYEVPMWVSWVAFLLTGYLSFSAFRMK